MPNAAASPGVTARHARVDVGVVPHVECTGGAGADRDTEQSGQRDHRMHVAGSDVKPDERREHHERHHSRLHQFDVIAGSGDAGLDACDRYTHLISGSVSN
jgi:hypothetical protein